MAYLFHIVQPVIFTLAAHLPGEFDHKTVARVFWECELHEELLEFNIAEKWLFTKDTRDNDLAGPKDAAAEYIVQNRAATMYNHECHKGCKSKGTHKLIKLCHKINMYISIINII